MKFIDQTGYELLLPAPPSRVVSVVPSQTELLFELGLDEAVVGITKFCVHPEAWFRTKNRVGGTKKLDIDKIRGLQPDLVLANKEENTKEDIEQIRAFCPVWTSNIGTIADAQAMIREVSGLFRLEERGQGLLDTITNSFSAMPRLNLKAAYLIWKKPYMVAGDATYISSMMNACGLTNVFDHLARYPEVSIDDIRASAPDILLLSSEPYPFKLKDIEALHEILPDIRIILVDGELFSWYGSRMKRFPEYVREVLV